MLSMTLSPSVVSPSTTHRSVNWLRFSKVGATAIAAAALANMLVYFVGDAIIGYNPDFLELGSALGIGIFTAFLALIAVLVYAPIIRYTENSVRNYTVVSVVALIVSLIPDFTFIPSEPGASTAQTLVLCLMHVVAAGVIVGILASYLNTES